jgi:hypothetical protein
MYWIIRFVLALQIGLLASHFTCEVMEKIQCCAKKELTKKSLPTPQEPTHTYYSADADEEENSISFLNILTITFLRSSERGICTFTECLSPDLALPELPPRNPLMHSIG